MFKIVPKDEKFYDQIEQLSHLAESTAQLMNDLVGRFPMLTVCPIRLPKPRMRPLKWRKPRWNVWTSFHHADRSRRHHAAHYRLV